MSDLLAPDELPAPPVSPDAASSGFALSLQQRRAHALGTPALHGVIHITAESDALRLDPVAWERAAAAVVARHEILRTTFLPVPGGQLPLQVPSPVADASAKDGGAFGPWIQWQSEVDRSQKLEPGDAAEAWLTTAAEELAAPPFDSSAGPLVRLCLVDLSRLSMLSTSAEPTPRRQWALLVAWSALIADAPSLTHFANELVDQLVADAGDEDDDEEPRREEPLQYVDFAHWQQQVAEDPDAANEAEHWAWTRDAPATASAWTRGLTCPGPDAVRGRSGRWRVPLAADLGSRVRAAAAGLDVDEVALVLAAWHALAWRYEGGSVWIACAVDGRAMEELDAALGPFVSHLPTVADIRPRLGFDALARQMNDVLEAAAAAHEVFSWDALPKRDSDPATFDYGLDVTRGAVCGRGPISLGPFRLASVAHGPCLEPFRWTLEAQITGTETNELGCQGGPLALAMHGRDVPFRSVAALADALETLLSAACAAPDTALDDLPLAAGPVLEQALAAACGPPAPGVASEDTPPGTARGRCVAFVPVHQRIAEQLAAPPRVTGENTALVAGARRMDRSALLTTSGALARWLRAHGVGAEVRVALIVERSPELVVALLGVLQAGGAYVPIDPAYPPARQQWLLNDSGASLLLTSEALVAGLPASRPKTVTLESIAHAARADATSETAGGHAGEPSATTAGPVVVMPEQLAYVLYTSGSTGHPKGVGISHGALASYLDWAVTAYFGADKADRSEARPGAGTPGSGAIDDEQSPPLVPVVTSPSFDLTVTSLLAPLVAGHGLLLVDEARGLDALAELLAQQGRTSLLKLTPSHLRFLGSAQVAHEDTRKVDCLVVGGEALHAEHLAKLAERWPTARLVNEYGPTEATVGCIVYEQSLGEISRRLRLDDPNSLPGATVPIGRPIPGARAYLLDAGLRPVPLDALGELYLAGPGLARGYLGQPARTAERFVPDPWSTVPGERLYRTGDQARRLSTGSLPSGCLVFVGRGDGQVKVRGHRIEIEEIERTAARHPAVDACAVTVTPDATGEDRLVGYWVAPRAAKASTSAPSATGLSGEAMAVDQVDDPAALRAHLAEHLPAFMVPDLLIPLDRLPLTVNGKLDRGALPAPETVRPRLRQAYVAPRDDLELALAAAWQRFLGLERVGIDDRVFDLGGNSWLALQVHAALAEQRGLSFPVIELFNHPTVRALADHLREQGSEEPNPQPPGQASLDQASLDQASEAARRRRQAASGGARRRGAGRPRERD